MAEELEDEREIIYIALSNQVNLYSELLEAKDISEDDKNLSQYIIDRSLQLLDKYEKEITDKPNIIPRPLWNQHG